MLGSLPTHRDRGGAETRMEYVAPGSDWILPQLGSEPSVSQIKNRQFFTRHEEAHSRCQDCPRKKELGLSSERGSVAMRTWVENY